MVNPKLSDAVRAAAMIGIQRHVSAKIADDEARKKLIAALLQVAAADVSIGSATAPGQEWILAQALETLGMLAKNAAFPSMVKTVGNSKLSLPTRSVAAEAMGRLDYSGATINPVEAAAALGRFAIDACTREVQAAKVTGKPVSRRRMRQYLGSVLRRWRAERRAAARASPRRPRTRRNRPSSPNCSRPSSRWSTCLTTVPSEQQPGRSGRRAAATKLEAWLKKQPK